MTPSIYEAGDDRMVPDDEQMPEDDQMVAEEFTADPAGAVVDGDPQSPASAVSEDPDATDMDDGAKETSVSGGADAERPSSVSAAGAQPRPARDSPLAIDTTRPGWTLERDPGDVRRRSACLC